MTNRQIPLGAPAAVLKAVTNLKKTEWNVPPFYLDSEHEANWQRYAQALRDQELGREFSDIEESYEKSRWIRNQAMIPNLDRFIQLCDGCAQLIDALTKSGWQFRLGNRAGLERAGTDERPSLLIEFKPEFPPEYPPLSVSDYERLLGGPHVFGARLMWWCAAAKTPDKFGYPSGIYQQLWMQPFWFQETGPDTCRINPRPLALIKDAAEFVARTEGRQEASTAMTMVEDGPGPGCIFHWEGKAIELQPKQFHLIEFLWSEWKKGNNPIDAEQVFDAVWPGDRNKEPAYASCISRLNKSLAEIPIIVRFRKAHFVLEVGSQID